jgi:hypothetical protein
LNLEEDKSLNVSEREREFNEFEMKDRING